MKRLGIFLFGLAAGASNHATASGLDAHVHGEAQLQIAQEGSSLEIMFESPAANIVGFEHIAKSDNEKQAVKQAQGKLSSVNDLFAIEGGDCSVTSTEVDIAGLIQSKGSHQHDKHKHHDHAENKAEHKDHKGHDHGTHHEPHHENEHKKQHSEHADIEAHYVFTCAKAEELKAVTVTLFEQFRSVEKINAQWVSENAQGSDTLKSDANKLELK